MRPPNEFYFGTKMGIHLLFRIEYRCMARYLPFFLAESYRIFRNIGTQASFTASRSLNYFSI